ncbi:MAG: saccharopine dehydrogenase family protein [Candidatus Aureabacteria bacterium]|nr:saccharopine dehydrogenase family protein [Candidatus Auribacterota bacterium]
MSTILIIGTGGVGSVVAKKCSKVSDVFTKIILANRTIEKAKNLEKNINEVETEAVQVDADNTREVIDIIEKYQPKLVINTALPFQDLSIMDACLETGVDYLDTANYEPPDEAKFCYKWQWDYHDRFKQKGIMALLGCGFDPGVTNIFCAHAKKEHFDEMHFINIMDANGGDHGQPFATNFNPEINIREITQNGKYYENGEWKTVPALSQHKSFDFPGVGEKEMYLLYHEEMESLVKHFPEIKKITFWMTFSQQYINYLKVLQDIGMTSIEPVEFEGNKIVPLKFLKALLPDPSSLGPLTKGQTCIGCMIEGIKNNNQKRYYIYNICDHEKCFKEVGAQAISYTTGVPAMIGAKLMLQGVWKGEGVFNVEQLDPTPFMNDLNVYGLPWEEEFYEYTVRK